MGKFEKIATNLLFEKNLIDKQQMGQVASRLWHFQFTPLLYIIPFYPLKPS